MFSGVQASTRLVHACSPACKPARGLCTHVLRRASQHELVHACSAACMSAQGRCTHAEPAVCWRARLRSPHAGSCERYADQRLWQGDSVTHCETRADGRHHQFQEPNRVPGSSEKLHLVKRFTPASDETISTNLR